MSVLEVLLHPDPILRLPGQNVEMFDDELAFFIENLKETLYAHDAIGLSATQVGDQRNVFVIDISETRTEPQVYVNPRVDSKSAWGLVEESCLSVPGVVGNVVRATQVTVSAQSETGDPITRSLEGMNAVCFQHELDHLEGRLFIDRLSFLEKLRQRFLGGRDRVPAEVS